MKLLVANRSEIACRIFQACKERGIRAVGVVAPGDEQARHVTFADEVLRVPSYLDAQAIVSAAVKAGVGMVHPGYGFLSERPHFARAVEQAGIAFLGPRAETMEQLGGKIDAKLLAEKSQVPTLPWARVQPGQDITQAALKVGFPLLLKAAAGGGGKGMRRVNQASELLAAAESASAEAVSSFGDGTLFLEKVLDHPRHIEVQVFGDGKGHVVHLHERECSLQRRHQKVWEEATAPNLSEATRTGLFEAALRLSQFVQYRSAGTLEFLVDDAGGFYFLEMNTRLQVEHPVTELVTGVDLVHTQIEQALNPAGTAIAASPSVRGHAIEVRIYAEDAAQGFLPTPGSVDFLRWPMGPGIRVDSGIEQGQEIGTSFDSMLAKLIVSAPTRDLAIRRMQFALSETVILGMGTNQRYLLQIAKDPRVLEGRVHTHYLEKEFAPHFQALPTEVELGFVQSLRTAAGATAAGASGSQQSGAAASMPSPWSVR